MAGWEKCPRPRGVLSRRKARRKVVIVRHTDACCSTILGCIVKQRGRHGRQETQGSVESSGAEEGKAHQAFCSEEKKRKGRGQACGATVSQFGGQHAGGQEPEEIMSAARGKTLKDPRGGLTRAGREWFAKKQGSHLKAGVKKSRADMTPADMRRKGSWAVRFYGRKGALPPLLKPNGEPTRYALSAAAWGEPVPKTVAAARRIAAKGRRLLAAYEKTKKKAAA
jgi:Domain of unknown function (DUF6321)